MLKSLITNKAGIPLSSETGLNGEPTLITESIRVLNANWQAKAITTAATTTIVEAKPNQSLLITDGIVILSKKVASATIVMRFYDGTNSEILFTFDAATASFQFSHAFQGGNRGWKDADFQVVTDQATNVSVYIGYVHINKEQTKPYAVWTAER